MKKLIALLLAVSVLFSLALTGCKSETPNTPNNTVSDTPSTPDDTGDNEPAASGKDPDRLIKIGFVFSAIVSTDAWRRRLKTRGCIWKKTVRTSRPTRSKTLRAARTVSA